MSSIGPALRRVVRNPGLLVFGVLLSGVTAVALVTTAEVVTGHLPYRIHRYLGAVLAFGILTLRWVVVGPLLAGNIAVARSTDGGVTSGLKRGFGTIRSDGTAVLAATLKARLYHAALALVLVPVFVTGALVLLTVVALVQRAAGVVVVQTVYETAFRLSLAALLAGAVAWLPLRFVSDQASIDPRSAARVSVRRTFGDFRATARYAAVASLPLVVPLTGAIVLTRMASSRTWTPVLAGAFVASALGYAVLAAYHAEVTDSTSPGTVQERSVTSTLPARRPLVLAVLLVAGLAVGTGAIRVTEAGPYPQPAAPVSDSDTASSVLQGADTAIEHVNHRRNDTYVWWNTTTGARSRASGIDYAADHRDSELRTTIVDADGERWDGYLTDAVRARRGEDVPGSTPPFSYRVGGWLVTPQPNDWMEAGVPDVVASVSNDDSRWRILERTDERVVVGITDSNALQRATGRENGSGYRYRFSSDSFVRVVVDVDTGFPVKSVSYLDYTTLDARGNGTYEVEDRTRRRSVSVYSEWRTADVRRPASIGGPSVSEVVIDALAY